MGKGHSALVLRKQYSGVEDYGKPDSMPLEGGSSAAAAAAAAKSLQSCPTLCDPIDGSLPGSPVPGGLIYDKSITIVTSKIIDHRSP